MHRKHALISAVIVFCLLMQAVVVFVPRDRHVYPFIDYPMYRAAHGPPVTTQQQWMQAELADGRWVEIDPQYMGLRFFAWNYRVVSRIIAPAVEGAHGPLVEDHRQEALERALRAIEDREETDVETLHVGVWTYELDDEGLRVSHEHIVVPIEKVDDDE